MSDSSGQFVVQVLGGRYFISAGLLGYRTTDPIAVVVDYNYEQVEVEIRLSVEPIEIGGPIVVARGLALRHRASLDGFRDRHTRARPARV